MFSSVATKRLPPEVDLPVRHAGGEPGHDHDEQTEEREDAANGVESRASRSPGLSQSRGTGHGPGRAAATCGGTRGITARLALSLDFGMRRKIGFSRCDVQTPT